MVLDGRIEKRNPLAIPLYLVSASGPVAAELVLTENVSTHGVCAVTKRRWQPGEIQRISSLSGKFHLPARVVYCHPRADNSYCVGLEFGACSANWWDRAAGAGLTASGGRGSAKT